MRKLAQNGFTFSEMLIAMSLLALLATMLIPMVAERTTENKLLTNTKDAAAQLAQAYIAYSERGGQLSSSTSPSDIVDQMNYVREVTSTLKIQINGADSQCSASTPCVLLHSGALMQYDQNASFGCTPNAAEMSSCWFCDPPSSSPCVPHSNINALRFILDADGTGPDNAITLILFYNGRVTTRSLAPEAKFTDDSLIDDTTTPEYAVDWVGG